ncbi:glycosyltransferase 87 family protein [Sphingomonas immobilis]|uniref:Glycosyltransferase 87 family protein n=1 Tax=Sphingomonas immobilis TaxID=3063997 RepID=A0ABT9A0X9_9SPHN|nr:glycosyltransferase 87 family protein [Sphingomonas sp. CA1-15]MDO7843493.1 glycosyltransferase 87 family protein [Sphingomonas sp. CA1-15]
MVGTGAQAAQEGMAGFAVKLLLKLMAANLAFNIFARLLGCEPAFTSFLFDPAGLFDDYYKFILSFPGGAGVVPSDLFGLHDRIAAAIATTPYHGVDGLGGAGITHFLAPPLTAVICLANLAAMHIVDPAALFVGIIALMLVCWCSIAARLGTTRYESIAWAAIGLASYPMLMMLSRGNIYAGLAALLICQSMSLALRGKAPVVAAICLAVALNIRPNAAPFAVPLLLLFQTGRWRALAVLAVATALIFALSLAVAHALYPDYTIGTFLRGLHNYRTRYIVDNWGLAYGSSLMGAVQFFAGYRPGVEAAAAVPAALVMLAAVVLFLRRRISAALLLFLTCSAYCLGSSVIADYHLLVFVLVPAAVARQTALEGRRPDTAEWIACAAACLLLGPKNYLFLHGFSWQVVLNPAIMLGASLAVIALRAGWISASAPGAGYWRAARAA